MEWDWDGFRWYAVFDTTLFDAAASGDVAAIRTALERDDSLIDTPNPNDNDATPLLAAARSGHAAAVQLLLDAGSRAIDCADSSGRCPLSAAVAAGSVDVATVLLRARPPASVAPSLLALAAGSGQVAMVRLLIAAGADASLLVDAASSYSEGVRAALGAHPSLVALLALH